MFFGVVCNVRDYLEVFSYPAQLKVSSNLCCFVSNELKEIISQFCTNKQDSQQMFFFLNFQPGGTQTLTEFDVKWRNWHEEVDRCLKDNSFASNQHLELICKVSDLLPTSGLLVFPQKML